MAATYEPIATTTLGSAAAAIEFTSIGAGYTDLICVISGNFSVGSDLILVQFNSDTGSNYSRTRLGGNGLSAFTNATTNASSISFGAFGGEISLATIHLFSYAGSTYKTILGETSADTNGGGSTQRSVGLWRNTAAITSVKFTSNSAYNFTAGTTATLYGILKA